MSPPPYDPECEAVLKATPLLPPLTPEVVVGIRDMMASVSTPELTFTDPQILHEEKIIAGPGGHLPLCILRCRTSAGGARPGILYMHGGGMILGSNLFGLRNTFDWVKELDAVLISVDYRLAPENPYPAPIDDCYAALNWVSQNAAKLGIDAGKVIVAGHSAGGNLAASLALLSRDRKGPKVFAQLLIYPMLDDRMVTVSSQQCLNEGTWSGQNNIFAWNALLSGRQGGSDVSIYAAPSRATNLRGLPQTWIDVGSADLFRDEDIMYASRLLEFGVPTELYVGSGGFHGYDDLVPNSSLTKSCLQARMNWLKRIITVTPVLPQKIPAML